VTYDSSVVRFPPPINWPPRYNKNIVESGVKHYKLISLVLYISQSAFTCRSKVFFMNWLKRNLITLAEKCKLLVCHMWILTTGVQHSVIHHRMQQLCATASARSEGFTQLMLEKTTICYISLSLGWIGRTSVRTINRWLNIQCLVSRRIGLVMWPFHVQK